MHTFWHLVMLWSYASEDTPHFVSVLIVYVAINIAVHTFFIIDDTYGFMVSSHI